MKSTLKISAEGWLEKAIHCPSPNHDERAANTVVSLLVIHNISLPPGEFSGNAVEEFFQNKLDPNAHPYFAEIAGIEVSSHLFIRRDGRVIQFVPFTQRAWHAGKSCFEGESACNNYSIGIEMEGCDDLPYSNEQYEKLAEVTEVLQQHYPAITADRITGHEHIAPGRKTDPGPAFDWQRYLLSLSFNPEKLVLPPVQDTLEPSSRETRE